MSAASHLVRSAAALLAASVLATTATAAAPARTLGIDGQPITNTAGVTFGVLSHRGGALQWPENSVEAYTGSALAGYDAIEADILFTSDARAVMSHYDTLPSRCTRAGKKIHQLTWAQVSAVRCANLAGKKVVPIPTFEQLAAVLKTHPGVGLSLDIKSYSGQSSTGQRTFATRAVKLLIKHQLLARSSIISFNWDQALPAIRTLAPTTPVLALDQVAMDLNRVRLAAKLKATSYGIKMKYTSAYLARFVKSQRMTSAPSQVIGNEQLAFTIHYGGKTQLFSSDWPAETTKDLVDGKINVNPVPVPTTTTLATPVTISKATYVADQRQYPLVIGTAVPSGEVPMLDTVTLAITVTGGTGTGILSVGARSSDTSSSVQLPLPSGSKTLTVKAPVGNSGKLRIYTTSTVQLTVKVVGYTRIRFPSA